MTAAVWFLLGAVSFGTVLGLALFVVLAGPIRKRSYEVSRELVLLEFGIRPAVSSGFDPADAVRWPELNRQEPTRPAPFKRPLLHDR